MNRTSVRNFHEFGPLFISKSSGKMNFTLDPVDLPLFGFTLRTIDRVNFRMIQGDGHTLEWPASSAGIKRDRHGSAGAEGSQKKVVRRWPGISPAESDRFIAGETV